MIRPKRYLMKLPGRELQLGDRTLIMGIVNVTPDSFSDGGDTLDPDRAYARAMELEEAGADIIDIGAESTRPGSERVSEAEELHRLIPVLKRLRDKLSVPISVDTMKSAVAAKALENGAEIINDPTTLTFDAELAKVVAAADAALILNHMRGTPETWAKLGNLAHPMKAVLEDLDAGVNRARRAGIDRGRIIVDPGLGFGKRGEQNYELIARLGELVPMDLPVLVGPSRKSFLGQRETIDADRATSAAVTAAVLHGAHIVRVHDVAAIRAVLQTADGILRSIVEEQPARKPKKIAAEAEDMRANEGKPLRPPVKGPVVKPFEERPRRVESEDRPPRRFDDADRPPPRKRFDSDDRPPRRFDPGERPSRPPFRDRGGDERPPFKKPFGDRPPFRKSAGEGGDRPYRKPAGDRGDRPPYRKPAGEGGDRPPYRRSAGEGADRPYRKPAGEGSDRPPYRRSAGEGGDRPYRKPAGDRGDRPPYRKPAGEGGDRPPFRRSAGPGGGDRPPFKKPFGGGGKPPFGKDSGGFKPKRSPVRSPRPKRDS